MDSLAFNKAAAAILVAGIVFMLGGILGEVLVHPHRLPQSAIKIEGAEPVAATVPGAKDEPLPPIAPLLAEANVETGGKLAKQVCAACHTFNQGGANGVGPNLYGVLGGPRAHDAKFNYTAGLKAKEGNWSFNDLNAWLKKPAAFVAGTRMAAGFAGIKSDKQRADVIVYLRSLAATPVPLP